jgi:hypothetical protein
MALIHNTYKQAYNASYNKGHNKHKNKVCSRIKRLFPAEKYRNGSWKR